MANETIKCKLCLCKMSLCMNEHDTDDVMMTSQFTYLWGLTHVSGCGQQVGGAPHRLAGGTEGCREDKVRLSAILEKGLCRPAGNLERGE